MGKTHGWYIWNCPTSGENNLVSKFLAGKPLKLLHCKFLSKVGNSETPFPYILIDIMGLTYLYKSFDIQLSTFFVVFFFLKLSSKQSLVFLIKYTYVVM